MDKKYGSVGVREVLNMAAPIPLLIRLALTPVDLISDVVAGTIGSPDMVKVEDKGDKIIKYYVYRRTKLKPIEVDKIALKLMEMLEPPLRDPRRIKVLEIKPLEEGALTEDVIVAVEVPKYGMFTKKKLTEKAKKVI